MPTDSPRDSFLLDTRRATRRLARSLAPLLRPADLVILDGQLGSGKTFFVRALSRALGLDPRIRVTSPTFSLLHEIATVPRIAHADLYRLNTAREVENLGLTERRDEGDVLLVEWGVPYVQTLGGDALTLYFEHDPRRVSLVANGRRASELCQQLVRAVSGDKGLLPLVGPSS
jgi:tRNA threonylcarbamoyladenosine biosynthesis protein TsaE